MATIYTAESFGRTRELLRQLDNVIDLGQQLNQMLDQNTRLMEVALQEQKAA